jgi:hypothetical protein
MSTPAPVSGVSSAGEGLGFGNAARARETRRLALVPAEAAASIGCSRDFFDEHVLPELRVVRRGRLIFVPVVELERWLDEASALTLGSVG